MLPVAHGDALWIEYGSADAVHRVLIDGGPAHTYEALRWQVAALPPEARHFELLVVTHVDADHIEGIIKLLQDEELGCTFRNIWFNDWKQIEHLPGLKPLPRKLGPVQGEFLGGLIEQIGSQAWNAPWDGKAVYVPDNGDLPSHTLDGGLKLTILSPGLSELEALRKEWDKVIRDAGFTPGDKSQALEQLRRRKYLGPPKATLGEAPAFGLDSSIANGSSIALLAEYDGHRVLLAGDAYAQRLRESLVRWSGSTQPGSVKLDAFKLPHHGSKANLTSELLELLKCKNYLVSTSGAVFDHPDDDAINLVIDNYRGRGRAQLLFNYRSARTEGWADPVKQDDRHYNAIYPEGADVRFYAKASRRAR